MNTKTGYQVRFIRETGRYALYFVWSNGSEMCLGDYFKSYRAAMDSTNDGVK